jgi:hypothetical protein
METETPTPTPPEETAAAKEGKDTAVDSLPDASAFTLEDWPIPSEAEEVEFITGGELTYVVAWDMETVASFYRPIFEHLGLDTDCLDDVGEYTSKSCSLLQNNVVVNLSLHEFNGKSDVSIDFHNYALEDYSATTEPELFNVGDIVEMGVLDFVVDEVTSPEESAYPPDEGNKFLEIVFRIENGHTSDTIDAFSALWLSINDLDGNYYGYEGLGFAAVDDPDDAYGSHNGNLEPGEQARGGVVFQVPVDAKELVLVVDAPELGADEALIALPETEAPPGGTNIPDFLAPADAQDLDYDADSGSISYISPTDVESVIEFYRQSLPAEGWQEDEEFSYVSDTFAFVLFEQGEDSVQVEVLNLDDDTSEVYVDISLAWSLLGIVESGTGDTMGDSCPLRLVEVKEFPVPSDNTHWQPEDWQSDLRRTAAFASPSDLEALVELYETELPEWGWEFIEHSLDNSEAHLYFEGDGQEFFIDLRTEGNRTVVALTIRNPAAAAEVGIVLPPSGQGRIYLGNFGEAEVVVTIDGQDITIPPDEMETLDEAPFVDLPPGVYTITADIPDFGKASDEIELDAGEVWTIMVAPGGLLPIQAY